MEGTLEDDDRDGQPHNRGQRVAESLGCQQASALWTERDAGGQIEDDARDLEPAGENLRDNPQRDDTGGEQYQPGRRHGEFTGHEFTVGRYKSGTFYSGVRGTAVAPHWIYSTARRRPGMQHTVSIGTMIVAFAGFLVVLVVVGLLVLLL